MAKKESLKNHSIEDLNRMVTTARDSLRTLRFSVAGSKNRNVKETRTLRKEIARGLTEITARNK